MVIAFFLTILQKEPSVYDVCVARTAEQFVQCSKINATTTLSYLNLSNFLNNQEQKDITVFSFCDIEDDNKKPLISEKAIIYFNSISFEAHSPNTRIHFSARGTVFNEVKVSFTNFLVISTNVSYVKSISFKNSMCVGVPFNALNVHTDLLSDTNLYNETKSCIDIDMSDGIQRDVLYSNIIDSLSIRRIRYNCMMIFSGSSLIFRSTETQKELKILADTSFKCHVFQFESENLVLEVISLFMSITFRDIKLQVDIDNPMTVIMQQSAWEGTALEDFNFIQKSNCTFFIHCEIMNYNICTLAGSLTHFIVKCKNALIGNRINVTGNVKVSAHPSINDQITVTIKTLVLLNDSNVTFSDNIDAYINVIRSNTGINGKKVSLYGNAYPCIIHCESGTLFMQKLISNPNLSIAIVKPTGFLKVDEYITNNIPQVITSLYVKSNTTLDPLNTNLLSIKETDNLDVFKIIFYKSEIKVGNVSYCATTRIESRDAGVKSLDAFIVYEKGVVDDASLKDVFILENSSYSSYCNDSNICILQDQMNTKDFMCGSNENISLYVAGNIKKAISSIGRVYRNIKIYGVTQNACIHLNDADFMNIYLSNVSINFDEKATVIHLVFYGSMLSTEKEVVIRTLDIDANELKLIPPSFTCLVVFIIVNHADMVFYVDNKTVAYDNINMSIISFNKIMFVNDGKVKASKISVFIYGMAISNIIFCNANTINMFCYSPYGVFSCLDYQALNIYTNTVPSFITLPSRVYISSNVSYMKTSVLSFRRYCTINSGADTLINAATLMFVNSSSIKIYNSRFKSNNLVFKKSYIMTSLDVFGVKEILIDSYSYVVLNIPNKIENLNITTLYYMGSVPYIYLDCDVKDLTLVMLNTASVAQLYSGDNMNAIEVQTMHLSSSPKYTSFFKSKSWAFNNDTREFDIIGRKSESGNGTNFYIVKRQNDEIEDDKTKDDDNEANKKVFMWIGIGSSIFVLLILIIVVIHKVIQKNRINSYVSVVSDQLVDIV